MARYTIYGDLNERETATLAMLLHAKGLEPELVDQTPSLALALATRAGSESGPYLRTPEGFVLADLHAMLELIERVHPEPRLVPTTPVRRACLRLPRRRWLKPSLHRASTRQVGVDVQEPFAGFSRATVGSRLAPYE